MNRNTLIDKNKHLFWYIKEDELHNISDAVLVEFILNFGTLEAVKDSFRVLGKDNVALLFSKAIKGSRDNYFPQVKNFFDLYFKKNVPEYPF